MNVWLDHYLRLRIAVFLRDVAKRCSGIADDIDVTVPE